VAGPADTGDSSRNAAISGVAGVIVWTENFAVMARFYRDVLGLSPRSVKADFINFAWGGLRLSVAAHDGVHGVARDPLRIMINFAVEDIDAAVARLQAAAVAFTRLPEAEEWGGRVATFLDPDGNTLQLLQLQV
jgi:predicted enzyme related to lactoylglutathione lyase